MMGDEGVGVRVIRRLLEDYILPPGVDAVDGGTGGLSLLPLIRESGRVILVDALDAGAKPGSIFLLEAADIEETPRLRLSLHDTGILDVLRSASLLDGRAPATVIGIQPARMDEFGGELSEIVENRMEDVLGMILEMLAAEGLEPHPRGNCSPLWKR